MLVADDNPMIRKMLCQMFENEDDDYDLFVPRARDGREAIAFANLYKPEQVILHLSMQDMNGIDAARELKQQLPAVIIIFALPTMLTPVNTTGRPLFVDVVVSKGDFNSRLLSNARNRWASPWERCDQLLRDQLATF